MSPDYAAIIRRVAGRMRALYARGAAVQVGIHLSKSEAGSPARRFWRDVRAEIRRLAK